ncbi:MAG: C40 family peptidase [Sphingobium sp.]|nr:C40 family peptidase [Sphingobium sp.]
MKQAPVNKSVDRKRVALDGVSRHYDARVHAIRPDLADVALANLYFAPHYAAPVPRVVIAPSVPLRAAPGAAATAVSELLHGETFNMLDARGGWAWGYCGHDHYVGYLPVAALGEPVTPSHVATACAPVFSSADIKSAIATLVPAHGKLSGTRDGSFLAIPEGFVHTRHVRPLVETESDWVSVAERHIGTPYVWGGRGGLGLDCSGLVQVALAACGIACPRDTDQQAEAVGTPIDDTAPLRRGDVIFFPGHVGLMVDDQRLVHANAHWMAVTIEPLSDVIARLADKHERPVTARRRVTP